MKCFAFVLLSVSCFVLTIACVWCGFAVGYFFDGRWFEDPAHATAVVVGMLGAVGAMAGAIGAGSTYIDNQKR